MTTLALSLPRMRKIPRPPKALVWKALHCLCWAVWTILVVLWILLKHRYWMGIFGFFYAKWMIRDYRELIKMIEAWLDEKPVKLRKLELWLIVWTMVGAPISASGIIVH
jgi:hypothetical protein